MASTTASEPLLPEVTRAQSSATLVPGSPVRRRAAAATSSGGYGTFDQLQREQQQHQQQHSSQQQPRVRLAAPQPSPLDNLRPKNFFANERTFIRWMRVSVMIGAFALGLLNFGKDSVRVRISALIFIAASLGIMLYAYWQFWSRAERLRRREPGYYDDKVLPVVVVIIVVALVAINFGLTFRKKAFELPPPAHPSPTSSPATTTTHIELPTTTIEPTPIANLTAFITATPL